MASRKSLLLRWIPILLSCLLAASCACSMGGGDDSDSSSDDKPSAEANEPSDDNDNDDGDDDEKSAEKEEDKEPSKDAPKITFDKYNMTVKGDGAKGNASFFLNSSADNGKTPLVINAYFKSFPKGTVITVGEDSKKVASTISESMNIDVRPFVGALSLDDVKNKEVTFDVEASIELPDHKKATFKLPPFKASYAVASALAQARDKPVLFKNEAKDADKADTIAIVKADSSMSNLNTIGGAKTISEIDFVGVSEQIETDRTKVCKGYSKAPKVTVKMFDATVAIYDRRTGDIMREGTVKAKNECPMFVMINKEDNTAKHYPSDKQLEKWFRSELRQVKKMAKANAKAEDAPPTDATPPAAAAATKAPAQNKPRNTRTNTRRTTTKKPVRLPVRKLKKFRK